MDVKESGHDFYRKGQKLTPRLALIALKFLSSLSDNILCNQLQQIILGSNGKLDYKYFVL